METQNDSAGKNRHTSSTNISFWMIVVVGTSIGLAITVGFCHVIGLPRWFIIWACLMIVTFVAMPILTGGEAHKLNQRRATALFGIIPAIGVVAGLAIGALGFGVLAGLYTFSAVIVLCNFAYWIWFDVR